MSIFPEANKIKKEDINPNPKKLLIVKPPKTGGTRLAGALKDSFLLDLDGSSDFYETEAKVFDLKKNWKEYNEKQVKPVPYGAYAIKYLNHLHAKCKEEGPLAKYFILDTVTEFEEIAKYLALMEYKKTAMGKSFTEDDISLLPMGAGYGRIRSAFQKLYSMLEVCYTDCIIFIAHPKSSSIQVDGKELQATDVALTGKLKLILAGDVDAMGTMYRKPKSNINILNFKTTQQDLVSGARSPHLENRQIEISELLEDGTFVTHWDKIFV
jgi:hypothetical protein